VARYLECYLLCWSTAPQIHAQAASGQQQSSVSDKDLAAFVKAYVEVQKIRTEYEPVLKNTQDPQERRRIQQTGDAKVKAALEKQGIGVEKSTRSSPPLTAMKRCERRLSS